MEFSSEYQSEAPANIQTASRKTVTTSFPDGQGRRPWVPAVVNRTTRNSTSSPIDSFPSGAGPPTVRCRIQPLGWPSP